MTMLLTADRLFDGTGSPALARPMVRVDGATIAAVERSLLPPASCSGERFDFPGCTLLPGLIDTHVHLVFAAYDTNEEIVAQVSGESDDQLLTRALANAAAALRCGLTTVRDCGGRGRIVQEVRDRIARGAAVGADVLSCGAPITTPTGHCHWLGLHATTPDEVRRAAERMLAEGADFLKVMATGGNMTPSSDPMRAQYDDGTLALIADIGRRANRHTAAHVLSRVALPGAIAAGVRTVEHCDWRIEENRYAFDPELARRMVDGGQYVGLTMGAYSRRGFLTLSASAREAPILQRLDARFDAERRTLDAGVRFTLHSDAGVRLTPIDRFDLTLRSAVLELKVTPAEALRAATATAAEAIGLSDRGVLAAGRRADLVVVEGDPLSDIGCVARVRAVMKAGRWVVGAQETARQAFPSQEAPPRSM